MFLLLLLACATGLDVSLDHRATAEACATDRPATEPADAVCGTSERDACATHADCTDGANGRCLFRDEGADCKCSYDECAQDADCGATAVCACAGVPPREAWPTSRCIPADCRVDADCASGLCMADRVGCGVVEDASQLGEWGYYCATAADTCRGDTMCGAGEFCVYGEDRWSCSTDYAMTCE
ncbi:MAG: hypothetical protein Q8P41_26315 [Pseudomonadota bacterium]|nr:hypothetical protein [Pseudomonadota bacterium]